MLVIYLFIALAAFATSMLLFAMHRELKLLLGRATQVVDSSAPSIMRGVQPGKSAYRVAKSPVFDGNIRKPWGW